MQPSELLIDTTTYLAPAKALEGLEALDAERRLHLTGATAPHSIAEIVAHMNYWQNWFLLRAQGKAVPIPEHAAEGWPSVAPGEWPGLRDEFLVGMQRAAQLDPGAALTPPLESPLMAHFGMLDVIVHMAQHNAHHMGQVILLRQLMGLWPPPAGSWTW